MADNPTLEIEPMEEVVAPKKKGVKRRAFLIGGAVVVGGSIFGLMMADSSARKGAIATTTGDKEHSFLGWMKIGEDGTTTLYSPHIDFGQGSHTALAQMLADELDADWSKIKVEQAPAHPGFANAALMRFFAGEMGSKGVAGALPESLVTMIARNMPLQITGGSSAIRATGEHGFRKLGASVRLAMIEAGAAKLGVPASELRAENGSVIHDKSGKSLGYGALAADAAGKSLASDPPLKAAKDRKYIGKAVPRFDIPAKVNGTAKYGMDVALPDMRVATIMMAPVRGGKCESVDDKPALTIPGVEKVIKLDEAVVVIGKGYWQAKKGLAALAPKFSDGGHAALSTASAFAEQDKLNAAGTALSAPAGGKLLTANYKAPFLHQAMMEPFAMTAHLKDGKLSVWGGMQDPLSARMIMAKKAGLSLDQVEFTPMIMGGGFGRRFPDYCQILEQLALVATQVPYPVKLIWSREEEVKHGAYRPQVAARLQAGLGSDGKIAAWASDYAQKTDAGPEGKVPYDITSFEARHHDYITNQVDAYWRSVNASQHGFFNESFVDELAHAAGQDPYQFRRKHLPAGGRHLAVLDECAKRAGWGTPLPKGVGRGIAIVTAFGTIVAQVIEASVKEDGSPKVHKVTAVVDCGTVVDPVNGEAQIMGGIVMGLSSAIGEEITLEKGEVIQSNFGDYPILKMADSPPIVDVHFLNSGAEMGGLGEPGVPPAAPALCNALFAVTGKRIRQLPIKTQAKVA